MVPVPMSCVQASRTERAPTFPSSFTSQQEQEGMGNEWAPVATAVFLIPCLAKTKPTGQKRTSGWHRAKPQEQPPIRHAHQRQQQQQQQQQRTVVSQVLFQNRTGHKRLHERCTGKVPLIARIPVEPSQCGPIRRHLLLWAHFFSGSSTVVCKGESHLTERGTCHGPG
jgi:hypothetical protein